LRRRVCKKLTHVDTAAGPGTTLESGDIAPYTSVYGKDSMRRVEGGEGQVQERAYRLKHLEYLRDVIPK
jgi:hypothetical protein